ncbi:MAG: prepilin-type N-terminal cleavage/methylation domain-containing protein [Chitinispirillales bacterium]|jgi:type II secretory pathway pseudopilin PulG|nr:prepilin-type N-terminal cleavage/methylation domain-containing protein [Chitinispirillales bacterium]
MDRKGGMTLVEVLVYMVLAGFLLAPVIMLVQNTAISMARDAGTVSLRISGLELLNIVYDDLRNTGYKLNPSGFAASDGVSYIDTVKFKAYVADCASPSPTKAYGPCPVRLDTITGEFDLSSFMPENKSDGAYYDALTIRKGKLTAPTGAWGGVDTVTYKVENKNLKRKIVGYSSPSGNVVTLARNVEALKFRYSENLLDWYDAFDHGDKDHLQAKGYVQYVKMIIVTKDPKKLSPTKTTTIALIEPDGGGPGLKLERNDLALYERHEIVVPIPNNGLFP